MDKIFNTIRTWLDRLLTAPTPADPVDRLSPRDLADLPVYHPRQDRDCVA